MVSGENYWDFVKGVYFGVEGSNVIEGIFFPVFSHPIIKDSKFPVNTWRPFNVDRTSYDIEPPFIDVETTSWV